MMCLEHTILKQLHTRVGQQLRALTSQWELYSCILYTTNCLQPSTCSCGVPSLGTGAGVDVGLAMQFQVV